MHGPSIRARAPQNCSARAVSKARAGVYTPPRMHAARIMTWHTCAHADVHARAAVQMHKPMIELSGRNAARARASYASSALRARAMHEGMQHEHGFANSCAECACECACAGGCACAHADDANRSTADPVCKCSNMNERGLQSSAPCACSMHTCMLHECACEYACDDASRACAAAQGTYASPPHPRFGADSSVGGP